MKSKELEEKYINLIQANEGIIHKVINLYIDHQEDKKDAFQEVLLQAWKSFSKFEERSSFSTWLYKVALNTVFTYKRSEKKMIKPTESIIPDLVTTEPEDVPHEILFQLIRRLDKVDRSIMTLHLDGYKNKEIAEIMGLEVNHINVKIHRLKKQIVESFKQMTHGY